MAVVLRNVARHQWGWFSREDQRMHIQTMEQGARVGREKAKAWLEKQGKRVFEPTGSLSKNETRELADAVTAERPNIESKWISFMIKNDWLVASLAGSIVTLTAYPVTHNPFTRTLDLKQEFPKMYTDGVARPWGTYPPEVLLDDELAALVVGLEANIDDREHIDLTKHVFVD